MTSSYKTLGLDEPLPRVLRVTLSRPDAANAMNTAMAAELHEVFDGLATQSERPRCVVLTGSGERAFCAGADLKERNGMTDEAWFKQHVIIERLIRAIVDCPVPVLAVVNGAAFAGGLEIALACDFIYASQTARMALTETRLGIMPGAGGTQALPRAVGGPRALELILTARPFTAEEARDWGMVNHVCAPEVLMQDALATAAAIADNAPLAVRQAKLAIRRGLGLPLAEAMILEIEAYGRLVPTADRREGIAAFSEKRKPVFNGR